MWRSYSDIASAISDLRNIGEIGFEIEKDPEQELLSLVLIHLNGLFEEELTDEDMMNYTHIKNKYMKMKKVIEQAMMGGFGEAINKCSD